MVDESHVGVMGEAIDGNRARVLIYLHTHGVCSRASVARALNLTPAAVTKLVSRLLDEGIVKETGGIEGRGNRRSIGVRLISSDFHVIGVKIARSLVQIGVFDLAGKPLTVSTLPTVTDKAVGDAVEAIRCGISALVESDPLIRAVGMAVPGPYLRKVGRTALVSSMQGWRRINFLREFSHRFAVPVFVEQDARAGVLAHHLFDLEARTSNLAYYLLGEGVGLGILDNGRLINGEQGAATEVGHVSIDVNGRPCECGNVGCLEQYCSAVAIHQEVVERQLVHSAQSMSHQQACQALFDAAEDGDANARELVQRVGRYVGYGCVTIINSFNPRRIVIGDIVSHAGSLLLDAACDVVERRVIPEVKDETTIALSDMSPDATVTGAAAVAIEQLLSHPALLASQGKSEVTRERGMSGKTSEPSPTVP